MSLYSQAIACGVDPDECEDLEEVDCGHDWDMSCPPCRRCGGCPECGDCDCDFDMNDDDNWEDGSL